MCASKRLKKLNVPLKEGEIDWFEPTFLFFWTEILVTWNFCIQNLLKFIHLNLDHMVSLYILTCHFKKVTKCGLMSVSLTLPLPPSPWNAVAHLCKCFSVQTSTTLHSQHQHYVCWNSISNVRRKSECQFFLYLVFMSTSSWFKCL